MRKLMLFGALLAMVLVTAVPAIADVKQSNDQAARSGDSSQTITVTGGGDNSTACQDIQGINNTGNALNDTGVLQYFSDGSVGISGGTWEMKPKSSISCKDAVNQAASASGA